MTALARWWTRLSCGLWVIGHATTCVWCHQAFMEAARIYPPGYERGSATLLFLGQSGCTEVKLRLRKAGLE